MRQVRQSPNSGETKRRFCSVVLNYVATSPHIIVKDGSVHQINIPQAIGLIAGEQHGNTINGGYILEPSNGFVLRLVAFGIHSAS
jgi:hypothetical protein